MADKNKETENGAAPPKKKSRLILLVGLIIALAAGGGGGYFFLRPSAAKTKAAATKGKKSEKSEKAEKAEKSEKADAADDDSDETDSDSADEDSVAPVKEVKGKEKAKPEPSEKTTPTTKATALALPKDKDVKRVLEIQPFVLNLADSDDNRFLRLTLSLGMGDEGDEKPSQIFITRVRNAVLAILTTKTSTDVLSPDGRALLRKELLSAVRQATDNQEIQVIYITELIVQR